jgi:hypothetical protein
MRTNQMRASGAGKSLERVADGVDEGMGEDRDQQEPAAALEDRKERPDSAMNEWQRHRQHHELGDAMLRLQRHDGQVPPSPQGLIRIDPGYPWLSSLAWTQLKRPKESKGRCPGNPRFRSAAAET